MAASKEIEIRGRNLDFLYDQSKELILSGAAGTGKSVTIMSKLMLIALKYPKARILIARKTRESLTNSGLVTWEEKVLTPQLYQDVASTMKRTQRSIYNFPNGSEVVCGGLDKPTKLFSTEWDIIYIQECNEVSLNDWESLLRSLRNNRVPYQQLIGDTNPDAPTHWILQRAKEGKLKFYESRHEDNPLLFDRNGELTEFGKEYINTLDQLTGVRYQRLRLGKWVQAEGTVYEEFDKAVHLIDRFEPPKNWLHYWTIDFGFTNPFVWQGWVIDNDGRAILYKEIYKTQTLVEDHAKIIKELTKGLPLPQAIICDHDAEDRATLERHLGLKTIAAIKEVSPGIQAVKSRLRTAGDGKPRIMYMRDSLVEVDPVLIEKKLPTCTIEEKDAYIWDVSNNRKQGEQPLKKYDHGMDAERYLIVYLDGKAPISPAVSGGQHTFQPQQQPISKPANPNPAFNQQPRSPMYRPNNPTSRF